MWRSPHSPYNLIVLTPEQEDLAEELALKIPPSCFPKTDEQYLESNHDTRIVCETAAAGGSMLLTSNLGTISHEAVNKWAVSKGRQHGFPARPFIFKADDALAATLETRGGLEQGMRAAVLTAWKREPRTVNQAVDDAREHLAGISSGTGGHLKETAGRIVAALDACRNRRQLVESVAVRFPERRG